ncbi:hypothetical protein SFR_6301 [Streptomyces sp. FR-008]|nr:hypothetical protein SFR_6301 [Streptomyces sp. FR-008]
MPGSFAASRTATVPVTDRPQAPAGLFSAGLRP